MNVDAQRYNSFDWLCGAWDYLSCGAAIGLANISADRTAKSQEAK